MSRGGTCIALPGCWRRPGPRRRPSLRPQRQCAPRGELEQMTTIAQKYDVAEGDARNRALGHAGDRHTKLPSSAGCSARPLPTHSRPFGRSAPQPETGLPANPQAPRFSIQRAISENLNREQISVKRCHRSYDEGRSWLSRLTAPSFAEMGRLSVTWPVRVALAKATPNMLMCLSVGIGRVFTGFGSLGL